MGKQQRSESDHKFVPISIIECKGDSEARSKTFSVSSDSCYIPANSMDPSVREAIIEKQLNNIRKWNRNVETFQVSNVSKSEGVTPEATIKALKNQVNQLESHLKASREINTERLSMLERELERWRDRKPPQCVCNAVSCVVS
uniref:Uncharacterized protein n=1 Tax=Norrisiella sphaerica TaxID=552664 RepID=A0A7S2QSW8_9EUKA|mmetsp:Transcript_2353/g.3384  ORF Transcript_2353/g.3384 Transcript_2353/m.3384 type:complete len:143 (+) Transcript_2353:254-682(+)